MELPEFASILNQFKKVYLKTGKSTALEEQFWRLVIIISASSRIIRRKDMENMFIEMAKLMKEGMRIIVLLNEF